MSTHALTQPTGVSMTNVGRSLLAGASLLALSCASALAQSVAFLAGSEHASLLR
jgi:hypothetical protein